MKELRLPSQCALLTEEEQTEEPDVVYLWDNKVGAVSNGINYFDREAGEEPS